MKTYSKKYQDWHRRPSDKTLSNLDAVDCSFDELTRQTRDFYNGFNRVIFDSLLKAIWLKGRLRYGERAVTSLRGNGYWIDSTVAFFMGSIVGSSGKILLNSGALVPLQTYIADLYPDFFEENPFETPKYYAFPYKNISIEHMIFVYQHHDRLGLLDYADSKSMSIWDFQHWATDQAFCYNDSVGKTVYGLSQNARMRNFPFLMNLKNKYGAE